MVISTTSWISCPVPLKKTDIVRQMATVPGLTPGRYLIVNNQDTAGRCLEWLRDNVVSPRDGLAPGGQPRSTTPPWRRWPPPCPAGSGGVIFTPWLTGERSPRSPTATPGAAFTTSRSRRLAPTWCGPCSKGWRTTAAGCSKRRSRFTGRRLDPIRLIGGGAQSDLWCQIVRGRDGPPDRTGRRAVARQPPGRGDLRRPGPRRGRPRRGPVAGRRGRHVRSPTRPTGPSTTSCSRNSPSCTRPRRACSPASTAAGELGGGLRRPGEDHRQKMRASEAPHRPGRTEVDAALRGEQERLAQPHEQLGHHLWIT